MNTDTPRTDEWLEEEKRNPRLSGLGNWLDYCKQLERELTAVTEQRDEALEYADKLAQGLPDGMLPKDVEVLREANCGLAMELTAVTEQRDRLAEALNRIANNNVQDLPETDYAYELGRMEGIAKIALQSLTPDQP